MTETWGYVACSLTLTPLSSMVWRVWIQRVSLFRSVLKSEDEVLSMATICRWSVLCPGVFKCLAIEVSVSRLMSDLWLVKRVWSGVDVSPTYRFWHFVQGVDLYPKPHICAKFSPYSDTAYVRCIH